MFQRKTIDGLPIVNARHSLKITVKQCDLKKSNLKDPSTCAVARAIEREFHPKDIRVHLSRIFVNTDGKRWTRYVTPRNATTEIVAFDRGGAFEPGEYKFNAPRPSQIKRKQGANTRTGTGKKRKYVRYTPNVRSRA